MKQKWYLLLLAAVVTVGFVLRLYRLNAPLADWHSWRQVDTAGVTRRYVQEGIDILRPRYMDISSIPSGKDNPEGWRMVEFPLINATTAGMTLVAAKLGIGWDLVVWERLTSIFFSLGSIGIMYFLGMKFLPRRVALIAAALVALLPFSIYYSRVVLPEPKLMFFSLAAMYGFVSFLKTGSIPAWLVAVGAGAIATLLKPFWLIIFGPAMFTAFWQFRTKEALTIRWGFSAVSAAVVMLLPFVLWRVWITEFPEGIPASDWLFNAGGIRFRPAWFRWLFADRIGRLMLGYWGLIPFGVGLVLRPENREGWFLRAWLLGAIAYLAVVASGNVTHDYYQAVLVPIIAIYCAKGLDFLWGAPGAYFSSLVSRVLAVVSITFALSFSWYFVRDYFNINRPEIVEAGQAADSLLPKEARVIAPYGGDTAFLYQTNRLGWPVGGVIEDKVSKGASHYVSVGFDEETKELMDKCQVVLKTDKYVIVDVRQCDWL